MKTPETTEADEIVCGTDFSAHAGRAADAAVALANLMGKRLILVHVTEDLIKRGESENEQVVEPMRTQFVRARLHGEAERLRKTGAAVEEELLLGSVAERAILDRFGERRAGLVVLSSGNKTTLHRWTIGSVSESLAETLPCASLVVRDAEPFECWARGERALRIVVGTDFTTSAEAALRWVAELRRFGPCELTAAHVAWPPHERNRLGVYRPLSLTESSDEIREPLERDIRQKVAHLLGGDVRVCVSCAWGRADSALAEIAMEANADLLVVGTHQRHGIGRLSHASVSRGVLQYAPVNVACVPALAVERMAVSRSHECRRVLAAVDLGGTHGFAAPYAYGIANFGGTVRLVHVVDRIRIPKPLIAGHDETYPTKQLQERLTADLEARLHALAPSGVESREITTEVEVIEHRDAAEAICQAAERFNADVVCVGSHTRPGFASKMFGSVALGVLQSSQRPVLVVWPPAQ